MQLALNFEWPTRRPHTGGRGGPMKDLTGQVVNGCRVVGFAESRHGNAHWLVVAGCGHECVVSGNTLRRRHKFGFYSYRCMNCFLARLEAIDSASSSRARTPKKTRAAKLKIVSPPGEKYCPNCEKSKPIGEFYRRKDTPDGLQTRCKVCGNNGPCAVKGRKPDPIECRVCYDMPHRRSDGGCRACGGAFADEDMRTVRYHIVTNSAGGWDALMPNTNVSTWDLWPNRRPAAKRAAAGSK